MKQDCTYARTAQDLERKYSFGKTFADMLGLINDNRDKVDAVTSTVNSEIKEQLTELSRSAEEISAKAVTKEEITDVYDDIAELTTEVNAKMTSKDVSIAIREELQGGVDGVVITGKDYRFDKEGLTVSETGSEITNKIDNTGMYVKRNEDNVLVANAEGVEATDLHAKTYLIIGSGDGRSRFEDYGINRTGCFWVGG